MSRKRGVCRETEGDVSAWVLWRGPAVNGLVKALRCGYRAGRRWRLNRTACADDVATGAAQTAYCRDPATGAGPIGSGCLSRTKAGVDRLAGKGRRRTTRTKPAAKQDPCSSGRQDDGAQNSTSCGEANGTTRGCKPKTSDNRGTSHRLAEQRWFFLKTTDAPMCTG